MTTAAALINSDVAGFNTTKSVVGRLNSMPSVAPAFTSCTVAQSSVNPANSRTTDGRDATSGEIGQKSWAIRAISGRPKSTDPKKTAPTATVVATGWRKYAKV